MVYRKTKETNKGLDEVGSDFRKIGVKEIREPETD